VEKGCSINPQFLRQHGGRQCPQWSVHTPYNILALPGNSTASLQRYAEFFGLLRTSYRSSPPRPQYMMLMQTGQSTANFHGAQHGVTDQPPMAT